MSSRTSIITVTFNSAAVLPAMMASIPRGTAIIVVDNASTDDTTNLVADRPGARLIRSKDNIGFGRACNLGAADARTEYLLFLNPDARLEDGALEALERDADVRPRLGAANPLITDPAGHARLKMSSIVDIPDMPRPSLHEAGLMPVLSGAALFMPRAIFQKVGGFDPSIFLYHEDHEICSRILDAGHELWHLPSARVVHDQGTGTPKIPANAYWKGYQMARSRFYVIEKHKRGEGFRGAFWPAVLGCISPVNIVSKRRRAKFRGQVVGALSARKDGGKFTYH